MPMKNATKIWVGLSRSVMMIACGTKAARQAASFSSASIFDGLLDLLGRHTDGIRQAPKQVFLAVKIALANAL